MAKDKFVLCISLLLCLLCLCNAEEYSVHPFAAKASLLRFWRRELPNVSLPPFLLQKASPLNGTSIAVFSSLIDKNELGNQIASFCAAADLLCTRKTTSFADNKGVFIGYGNKDSNAPTMTTDNKGVFIGYGNKDSNATTETTDNKGVFIGYGNKDSNATTETTDNKGVFIGYGNKDSNAPTETTDNKGVFIGYGNKNSNAPTVTFSQDGKNTQSKDYFDKNNTHYSSYTSNATVTASAVAVTVEPGKFFRENKLTKGSVLPVPDLKDYMPPRSFLPRVLADKFPMSSKDIESLVKVFGVPENSTMASMMKNTVSECEREPAKGETKRCVNSVEGMAAFAKEVLGSEVQVLTTASTAGSREEIEIGEVKGLDGGKLTHSVSCHQRMYPYLAYYCHAVPQVRVYKAQMLQKKTKIDGVAICHVDTSVWSAKHAAFVALGGKPGEIEVCHWIFEDDLIWVPTN